MARGMARSAVMLAAAVMAGGLALGVAVGADAPPPAATTPTTTAASTAPASPLFTEVVAAYMEGRWDVLEKTLKEKMKELAGLTTEEQAGLATIRMALREGRQDWWATTKAGTKGQIMASLWGKKIPVQFDPKLKYGSSIKDKNGKLALNAGWTSADMDSMEPTGTGFTKGDVASLTAWANLGTVDSWSQVQTPGSQIQLDRYLEFRGKVTGMSYGTPGARRYGMQACLASFTEENPKSQTRMARRAIATMFMAEVLTHPELYPSVTLPATLAAENAESVLGLALADVVSKKAWTFAEDTLIRAAVKSLAATNGTRAQTTATITLPNKLTVSLDPKADEALAGARSAWIKEQFDKAKAAK